MKHFILFLLALFLLTISARAATYYVDCTNGNDTTGNGSSGTPWKTVQKGHNSSICGDTVMVSGTCTEHANFTKNCPSNAVWTAQGNLATPPVWKEIHNGDISPLVTFPANANYNVLSGFRFTVDTSIKLGSSFSFIDVVQADFITIQNIEIEGRNHPDLSDGFGNGIQVWGESGNSANDVTIQGILCDDLLTTRSTAPRTDFMCITLHTRPTVSDAATITNKRTKIYDVTCRGIAADCLHLHSFAWEDVLVDGMDCEYKYPAQDWEENCIDIKAIRDTVTIGATLRNIHTNNFVNVGGESAIVIHENAKHIILEDSEILNSTEAVNISSSTLVQGSTWFTGDRNSRDIIIRRNVIANSSVWGVYVASGEVDIYHNTFSNNKLDIYAKDVRTAATTGGNYAFGMKVRNNISENTTNRFFDAAVAGEFLNRNVIAIDKQLHEETTGVGTILYEYQDNSNVTQTKTLAQVQALNPAQSTGSIFGTADFVSKTSLDFTLQSTSDAIDLGAIITGYNDDAPCQPSGTGCPDVGYWEYGFPVPPPIFGCADIKWLAVADCGSPASATPLTTLTKGTTYCVAAKAQHPGGHDANVKNIRHVLRDTHHTYAVDESLVAGNVKAYLNAVMRSAANFQNTGITALAGYTTEGGIGATFTGGLDTAWGTTGGWFDSGNYYTTSGRIVVDANTKWHVWKAKVPTEFADGLAYNECVINPVSGSPSPLYPATLADEQVTIQGAATPGAPTLVADRIGAATINGCPSGYVELDVTDDPLYLRLTATPQGSDTITQIKVTYLDRNNNTVVENLSLTDDDTGVAGIQKNYTVSALREGDNEYTFSVTSSSALTTLTTCKFDKTTFTGIRMRPNDKIPPAQVPATIDLSLSMLDVPDPVVSGNNVAYTLNIINFGNTAAINTQLVVTLDSSLNYVSDDSSCTHNSDVVTCDLFSIQPSALRQVSIIATTSTTGDITTGATVSNDIGDVTLSNNTDSEVTTVEAPEAPPANLFSFEAEDCTPSGSVSEGVDGTVTYMQFDGETGTLTCTVTVPQTGLYYVWGNVRGENDISDSIHFQLPGDTLGDTTTWHWLETMPTLAGVFRWDQLNNGAYTNPAKRVLNLTAGQLVITLKHVQTGAKLDKIIAYYADEDQMPQLAEVYIKSFTPASCQTDGAGCTGIVIEGENFTPTPAVTVEGTAATNESLDSDGDKVTADFPVQGTAGLKTVNVTNPSTVVGTAEFTYTLPPEPPVNPDDNVANWLMNEGAGTTVTDTSGNSNTLTLGASTAAPAWVSTAGQVCSDDALSFDGVNDYASAPGSTSLNNHTKFTVSFCGYLTGYGTSGYCRPFSRESVSKFDDLYISMNSGSNSLGVAVSNSTGTSFATISAYDSITLNTRVAWSVTYDDAGDKKVRIYKDGSEVTYSQQPVLTGTLKASTNPVYVGNLASGDQGCQGVFDNYYYDNYVVDAGTIVARATECDSAPPEPPATNFYVSPDGNNANDGHCSPGEAASACAWQTLPYAYAQMDPGETLVLKNGTWTNLASCSGLPTPCLASATLPTVTCGSGYNDGTAANRITVKAETERQAFLRANGTTAALHLSGCDYWTVEGLWGQNQDLVGDYWAAGVFLFLNSTNITAKRLLAVRPNRNQNAHGVFFNGGSDNLVEESEVYDFHRHGISCYQTTRCVLRRNYANSRSGSGTESYETFSNYNTTDSVSENNISEGNKNIGATGNSYRIKVLGNVVLYGKGTALSCENRNGTSVNQNNTFENNVAFKITPNTGKTFWNGGCQGTVLNNNSIIDSASNGFVTDQYFGGTVTSWTGRNNLSFSNTGGGFAVLEIPPNGYTMDYSNSYDNADNYNPDDFTCPNCFSNSIQTAPTNFYNPSTGQGCVVYIPATSNMHNAGYGGNTDIGANIIYRYENGTLTGTKLWNQTTGQFPCGATVTGVNDDATFPTSSCVNVHERLNIGVNGCTTIP